MKKITFLVLLLTLIIGSCAKQGLPSGGPIDKEAPKLLKASPENYSINFSGTEIRFNFDEYVKLKDINKQLIISPPLKIQPLIVPQTGASKFIKIKIQDTLQPNTTYSFNFGNSIVDNNEENPLPFFKYVFSTGSEIDSLKLSGTVKDALLQKTDNFVSVILYEVDSTFTDSIIYNKPPRYVTNTLDSASTFNFENLKEGEYVLIGLKEENTSYKFNQKSDKIGFVNQRVSIPTDEIFELKLFKEIENYRALKPKQVRKNRIKFRYEGPYNNALKVKLTTQNLPEDFDYLITKNIKNDTLNYWFKPELALDSLNFVMSYKKAIDSFKVKLRKKTKRDSLSFDGNAQQMDFATHFGIAPSIPIVKIDNSKIEIINKDSVPVSFISKIDPLTQLIELQFEKKEKEQYKIKIYPNAFTDFYNQTNDTLSYSPSLPAFSTYGNIKVTLNNVPKTEIIVQLIDNKGAVKYEKFGKSKTTFDFLNIRPSKYNLRVIYDENANQKYDTGNYLKKIQPERVSYYPDEIEIRANWDIDQIFSLK